MRLSRQPLAAGRRQPELDYGRSPPSFVDDKNIVNDKKCDCKQGNRVWVYLVASRSKIIKTVLKTHQEI